MSSEVIHHVTLRAERLAAVLRAAERPVVVVHAHVHHKVVAVAEGLFARAH